MKVALMTWFNYDNYGTALQVSAMASETASMNNDVEVINYIPHGKVVDCPKKLTLSFIARKICNRIYRFLKKENASQRLYVSSEREKLFEDFRRNNLKLTKKCETLGDLENLNSRYDAFVCGSDQIWAPSCFDSHYFLDFVRDKRKKIAYAPSIGLSKIESEYTAAEMKKQISDFSKLSVREKKGADIIKDLTGLEAEVVCDPTLLKDEDFWIKKAEKSKFSKEEKYLAAYFLGFNKKHWEMTYKTAAEKNLKVCIIPIFEADLQRDGCLKEPVGPNEFLNLIKNAEYVCTDSFHAVLFSLIFKKNFSVFERFGRKQKNNQNSRIYNILELLNLENRLVVNKVTDEALADINYEDVKRKLDYLKNTSKEYLKNALYEVEKSEKSNVKNHIFKNNSLCCGCGVCAEVCPRSAIEIKMDSSGFYKAKADEAKCVSCGKCARVCPMQSEIKKVDMAEGKLFSYKDKSGEILQKSSSGGFSYRMSALLSKKGYSVVGCTFDIKEQKAKHIIIPPSDDEGLHSIQGSKYTQSDFSAVLHEVEKCKTPIAIFATPCQIAAAKKLLDKRDDVVYIDLICHGVPSYNAFSKYKEHLARRYGLRKELTDVNFRYKPSGWRNMTICSSDGNKRVIKNEKDDYYYILFTMGHSYMESCYDCRWRDGSEADIRIGDYWGKKFSDDATGVSMVAAMNKKGEELLKMLDDSDMGIIKEEPIKDYYVQQTSNFPKPVFCNHLAKDLQNEKNSIEEIVKKYEKPFLIREKYSKIISKIKKMKG